MNWLARLKKIETAPRKDATKPTKPGFVGFVGTPTGHIHKEGELSAANDPTTDADRWCWPHSEVMNTREIDTFMARLGRLTDRGLELDDAETLADRLVERDREADDRRICLECLHLSGVSEKTWSCRNWQRAGVAMQEQDAQLSIALVHQLQRCNGFMPVIT